MLIADAFDILSEANLKIESLGNDYVDQAGTPQQPKTLKQLIRVRQLFNLLNNFIFLNNAGDAITGTFGQDDAALNRLLLILKREAQITSFPVIPNPINTFVTNSPSNGSGSFPSGGIEGDLLYFHNNAWSLFPRGSDGQTLTSSPSSIVWSNAVGNGIPSGGSSGQFLKKNSNTSYDAVWASLSPTDIGVSSSVAELNILDGVTVGATQINYLTGLSENLSTTLGSKLSTSLANGKFIVGNGSDIAVSVTPTGDVVFDNTGAFSISPGVIVDTDINSTAGITRSKLAAGTADRIVINNNTGVITDAAAITASRVLVSNTSGIPIASNIPTTTLDFLDATSSIQNQLDEKLTVMLGDLASGDVITYNGSDWVNIGIGAAGQVLTTIDGISLSWGPATANGIPSGGATNQYLRKIDSTSYNAEWHDLVVSDLLDLTTTNTELNLLSGLTAGASLLNFNIGLTDYVQTQLNNRLTNNLAFHAIYVGGSGNTALQVSPGVNGSVLTVVAGHPTWQSPPTPGNVSGPVTSTDNAIPRWNLTAGDSLQDSGVIIDDSDNITGVTSLAVGAISSGQISIANQASLRLYETGSGNYVGIRASGAMAADYTITLPDTAPGSNTFLKYDGANYVWASGGGGGASAFTDLTDVPSSYVGEGGKIVAVKADETGLEFIATGSGIVTSVSGTSNRISSTGGTTPVIDIAATYVGQSSITTLGTVATGTWSATNIALGKGGTGASLTAPISDGIFFYDLSATSSAFLSPDASTIEINNITLRVKDNGITNAKIRQSAALSVVGNSVNSTGNINDISSSADGDVLWRSGTTLAFSALTKLGTITSGVWNGSVIGSSYGGAGTINGLLKANGSGVVSLVTDADITGKVLTGYTSGAGTLSASDNILQAIQKLDGNDQGKWNLASGGTLTGANTITGTTTNILKYLFSGLGTTQTDGAGFWLQNSTAATSGNQQISPSITWEGQGWKTTATAASQSIKFSTYVLPVQGTSVVRGTLRTLVSVNGGGYTGTGFSYLSDGSLALGASNNESAKIFPTTSFTGATVDNNAAGTFLGFTNIITTAQPALAIGLSAANNFNSTTGAPVIININGGFAPTSGSATFKVLRTTNTINQTGGANGVVTAVSPELTITSATDVVGYEWNPTTPSNISGSHYAFRSSSGRHGFGTLTPSAKAHIKGDGTTTGELLRLDDNGGTNRLLILDNGLATFSSTVQTAATSTLAAINIGSVAGTPSSLNNGDMWYNSTSNVMGTRLNGVTYANMLLNTSGATTGGIPFASSGNNSSTYQNTTKFTLINDVLTHAPAAITNFTTTAERISVNFNESRSVQWTAGALTTQREFLIQAPTYAFTSASTITDAITFEITSAPVVGTNAAFTRSWAARLLGNVAIGGNMFVGASAGTTAPTAFLDLSSGSTAQSSLRIRSGVAPTSPNDGDIWYDGTDLKMRVGGTTKTFTLV